jgi:ion channel-forming bestrophin family protein
VLLLQRGNWWRQIAIFRGTAITRVWPRLLVVTALAVVETVLHTNGYWTLQGLTVVPFSLVAVALGIFLGFRNNTSYDRFWEGRKLWGQLVNTSRTLTRQVQLLVGPHTEAPGATAEAAALHRELVYRVIAYVHALRQHLRDEDDPAALAGLLPEAERQALASQVNRPVAILNALGGRVRDLWCQGRVHPLHVPVLEQSLLVLTDIQGSCERIKSTPIPSSYTVLIHRIVALYTFALPFGLVDTIGSLTPVVVAIIGYAFFGLDAVGEEIEDPFGTDVNDLPLSTLSRMIEINLRQALGETDLPEPLAPVDGVQL